MNRKNFTIALTIALLTGCGSGTPETTVATTTAVTEYSTAAPEVVQTETEYTTSVTTAAAEVTEPVEKLPENTRAVDLYSIGADKSEYPYISDIYLPDGGTAYVLYYNPDGEKAAVVYGLAAGEEKAFFTVPGLCENIVPSNDPDTLFCLTEGSYYWGDGGAPVYTAVRPDYSCEDVDGILPTEEYGHRFYHCDGDIVDYDTGGILVKGDYNGNIEDKDNRINHVSYFIDENRFVYTTYGYEWVWNIGVYDYAAGACRELSGAEPDGEPYTIGCSNGKIYSLYGYHDTFYHDHFCVTDPDTFESTLLYPDCGTFGIAAMSEGGNYIIAELMDGGGTVIIDPASGATLAHLGFGGYFCYGDDRVFVTLTYRSQILYITDVTWL